MDVYPCSACGQPTHLRLLDAKDDGSGNFTILECRDCYGAEWLPLNVADLDPSSEAMTATRAARGET